MDIILSNQSLQEGQEKTINARDLHKRLQVVSDFNKWVKRRLKQGFMIQDQDYKIVTCPQANGRPLTEFFLSLDCAKSIAAMEKTIIGKQVRDYLIQIEKDYRLEKQRASCSFDDLFLEKEKLSIEKQKVDLRTAEVILNRDKFNWAQKKYAVNQLNKMANMLAKNGKTGKALRVQEYISRELGFNVDMQVKEQEYLSVSDISFLLNISTTKVGIILKALEVHGTQTDKYCKIFKEIRNGVEFPMFNYHKDLIELITIYLEDEKKKS